MPGKIKKKFIHLTYMYQASYLKHFTEEVFLGDRMFTRRGPAGFRSVSQC
jgi:hypothetical protein